MAEETIVNVLTGEVSVNPNYTVLPPESGSMPRATVAKSIVMQRLIDIDMMDQAYAALAAKPKYFARWFAPDHPVVYCDDPDAVAFVTALGLDPAEILAS